MKKILIITMVLLTNAGFAKIKNVYPAFVYPLNFSVAGEKIYKKMVNGLKYKDLSKSEKKIIGKEKDLRDSYWATIPDGCSWYCGGGPKKVTASSFLKSHGKYNYEPKNAHDFDYKTAWVEGAKGYGIGEYLLYTFSSHSPRITKIQIANGYVRNKKFWENNARVKKLKMYINNKPYAILNLKDMRALQVFNFKPIGRASVSSAGDESDWTMKFEILEVYKGVKYKDVVISEIFFDGLDVHCLVGGTKIQLSNGGCRNIEDLKVGDEVSYMDFESNSLKTAIIKKMEKVVHHSLVTYRFDNGVEITATPDHPFRLKGKGWASLWPQRSKQYRGFNDISKIEVGDLFLLKNGSAKLISFDFLEEKTETYTISELSSGDNFIANGFIVGVEDLLEP